MNKKIYVHEKILRKQDCRRKFIKIFLPKKRKERMQTKESRLISRLNDNDDSKSETFRQSA